MRLIAILWRFLDKHEPCLLRELGIEEFELVTTVPSSTRARDEANQLRAIVRACPPVRERFERLLRPADDASDTRKFDAKRYVPERELEGANVLLIDDTWTSGVHAQSAAYALKRAGAVAVCLVVIGRHVQPSWEVGGKTCEELLRELPRKFDWDRCVVHASA